MTTSEAVIRGYAQALLSIAQAEGDLERVSGELYDFAKALETHPELREALTEPGLPAERKRSLITDLIGERANLHTINALSFLIDQGRARELQKIIEHLAEVAAEGRQMALAEVRSAVALDDKQREAIQAALTSSMGRKIEVKVVVDPSVIGGIVTRIGDEVIDGSVRSRLEKANARLTGT